MDYRSSGHSIDPLMSLTRKTLLMVIGTSISAKDCKPNLFILPHHKYEVHVLFLIDMLQNSKTSVGPFQVDSYCLRFEGSIYYHSLMYLSLVVLTEHHIHLLISKTHPPPYFFSIDFSLIFVYRLFFLASTHFYYLCALVDVLDLVPIY